MIVRESEQQFPVSTPSRELASLIAPLAVGLLCAVTGCSKSKQEPTPQPNLILVTVDTLRADHLGCYGHFRPSSPRIDALAQSGLVFERAISSAPWTLPSVATIHTSLYPREHGAIGAEIPLRDEVTTLAESLQGTGYDTLAVVTHGFVSRRYNFDQGFATFDQTLIKGHDAITSPEVTRTALRYLRRKAREPFFLWVHYFDPHLTYVRHPEYRFAHGPPKRVPNRLRAGELRRAAEALVDDDIPDPFSLNTVTAVYDEEIAFTDDAIGRLFKGIERRQLSRPTIAALTADHGEYFMERGRFGHGRDVYDELVHVPLIIWGGINEKLKGKRYCDAVELGSLAYTFAELGQVDSNPFQGEDLLSLPETPGRSRPSFSEGSFAWGREDRKVMIEWKRTKLIHNLDDDRYELYNLESDPEEQEDLWAQEKESAVATELREALDRFSERQTLTAPNIVLSKKEIERLESLGYVQ